MSQVVARLSVKVGDLVTCNHPARFHDERRLGIIIDNVVHYRRGRNKMFKVMWRNGKVDNRLWDYDLKMINENW